MTIKSNTIDDLCLAVSALENQAAFCSLPKDWQFELSGKDCKQLLHNLCTNEIKKLSAGQGCEALIIQVQGRILAHVFIFVEDGKVRVHTTGGDREALLTHFEKYIIMEEVTVNDLSTAGNLVSDTATKGRSKRHFLVTGKLAQERLEKIIGQKLPQVVCGHQTVSICPPVNEPEKQVREVAAHPSGNLTTEIAKIPYGSETFLVSCPSDKEQALVETLLAGGLFQAGDELGRASRIEAGIPLVGIDITEKNLPQEIGREDQTISFTKGCYLGQEVVARIDALGHVNKFLVRLEILPRGEMQQESLETIFTATTSLGWDLLAEGKKIGQLTSVSYSAPRGALIALGVVKRGFETVGNEFELGKSSGERGAIEATVRVI
ncbi:MAG: hypothetical protein MPJ24_11240 [Pirellulaceae bacterium]|nr:hypothetical protein [Pirellulaceae bacterium]